MANWEYTVCETKNHNLFSEDATKLGKENWELVHVEYVNNVVLGFFKRPVVENNAIKEKR